MKKILVILLILSVVFLGVVLLLNPGYFYEDDVLYGNLYFSPHKILDSCKVSYGIWDGMKESMTVEIPDEVNGHRVTMWGDNYPSTFVINLNGIKNACDEEMIPGDAIVVPRHLTISIGKNLKDLRDIQMKMFYADKYDPSVYYQIRVMIHCSGENPYFYSSDGKLYDKSNNQLIDLFFYESDFQ